MTFAEAAMIMMSGGGANIQPLTVTQNSEYYAPIGVDGYNPIYVKVPDRYGDGYKDGYDEGYKDGREAQKKICDEEKAVLIEEIDRQGKEIEELKNNQGYTFPEGTSYSDIYQFVGGSGIITDKTLGIYIKTTVTDREGSRGIDVSVYDADGTMLKGLGGGGFGSLGATTAKLDYVSVDPATGAYDVCISYDGYQGTEIKHYTSHQTGTYWKLVGFGSSEHTIGVKNN